MKLTRWLGWPLLAGGLLFPGCRKEAPVAASPGAVSPPIDLGAVIRQVHFSFREEGGSFRAGHPTHAIAAGRDGRVELTAYVPARAPGATPERGGTLALRTVAGGRTGGGRFREDVEVGLREDGALVLSRGAVVEILVNTAHGLQQSWTFEHRPDGGGDLMVRVAVAGPAFQGETAGGLHFRDPGSPAGLRYGHAVWIDARGERTPVRARWSRGEIALRVPAEVVDRSTFPAVLDPYVSPEIETDAPISAAAYGAQGHARVSTNGASYLVVWDDFRDPATGTDIMGARLSLTGGLLDSPAFIICNAPGEQTLPAVADDNGSEYLVVWQDDRNRGTQGWDIYGAIVPAATGLPAPVAGTPLVAHPGDQTEPSIAFDGTTATTPAFFGAWSDTRAGAADIYGAHLERDGGIREAGGFVVSNAVNDQGRPAVAHDGSWFVVAWQDSRNGTGETDVFARRVSSTDTTLEPELQVNNPGGGARDPSVAGGSSYVLIAWTDYSLTSVEDTDVWGEILRNGAVQAPGSFAIADAGLDQRRPSVAFDGSRFGVVWEDHRSGVSDVFGTTVSAAGVPASTAGTPLVASASGAHLASGAANPLMVYSSFTPLGGSDVSARVMTGMLGPGSPVLLSTAANTQGRPSVGFDGQSYLVVWEDNRSASGSTDLWGVRVSTRGQVLDPTGIPISTAPGAQQRPAVAGGRGSFAVTWEDYRSPELVEDCSGFAGCTPCYEAGDVYGTVVRGDGGVVDPGGLSLAKGAAAAQVDPAVSFDGQSYRVVWADDRNAPVACDGLLRWPTPTDLFGQTMAPDGGLLGPEGGELLASDPGEILSTRIATLGDRHLVGWQNRLPGSESGALTGVTAALLGLDGRLLVPPAPLAGQPAASFALAAGRDRFWTAWQENRADGGMDVLVRPVDTSGDAGAVAVAAGTPALEGGPALAFDGRALALAFHATSDGGAADGIHVLWMDDTGAVLSPGPVAVNVSPGASGAISAAGDGQGHALVSYQKYDAALAISAQRVRGNLVQHGSQDGAPCATGAECFSGFCVDGVCCESACGGGAAASSCTACSPAAGSPAAAGLCRPRVQGTVCRAASAGCLENATCDGSSATCPSSAVRAAGATCRDVQDTCDVRESCDGTSPDCPTDLKATDGTTCGDAMACQAGTCAPVEPRSLYDSCGGCASGSPALLAPVAALLLGLRRRRCRCRRRCSSSRRMAKAPGLLGALLVAIPLTAGAAGQVAARPRPKLAFLGIHATTGVTPEMASSFSEYVQSEVTAVQAYDVIGVGEIQRMLGLERQRQLIGCTQESSCVAEMVGALNAERAVFGDVARLGDSMVLNVSLMDLRRGKLLSRVSRRVAGTTVEPLLDVARPVVYELLRPDPALEGRTLSLERGFGGLRMGLRADADVVGRGLAPGLCADVSTRLLGGGLTLLYGSGIGVRVEGRLYPMELDRVRPYAGAGATLFIPAVGPVVGLRGVAGAEVRLWSFSLTADVAYERFLTQSPLLRQDALLLGAGLGYLF